MFTSTIVLRGKVVTEGVGFSWWVTDGAPPRLTVSHPLYGTQTHALADGKPETQARALAQAMLVKRVRAARDDLADDINTSLSDDDTASG